MVREQSVHSKSASRRDWSRKCTRWYFNTATGRQRSVAGCRRRRAQRSCSGTSCVSSGRRRRCEAALCATAARRCGSSVAGNSAGRCVSGRNRHIAVARRASSAGRPRRVVANAAHRCRARRVGVPHPLVDGGLQEGACDAPIHARLRRLGWCRHGRGDRGKWRQRGLQARRDRRRHSPQQPNRGRSYLSSKTIWRTLTHTVRKLREFANITEIGLASYSQRTVRVELLSERGREDFVSGVDSSNLPSSLRRRRKRTSAQQSESARRALPRRRRRRSALPFWRSARKRGAGRATRRSSATTTRSGARQTP